MKCEICKVEVPKELNSIVCSDRCNSVRLKMIELTSKYFLTKGCDNCHGDLHQGCTNECKTEFANAYKFVTDLHSLLYLIYSKH